MGRDDAKAVGDLQGGRAPAQAFAAFMKVAVAKRPVEKFATAVTFPERFESEEGDVVSEDPEVILDENGMPIEGDPQIGTAPLPEGKEPDVIDQEWIDQALGKPKKALGGKPPPEEVLPDEG